MRALRYLLLGITIVAITVVIGVLIIASRPEGFAWLAREVPAFVPGDLSIEEPTGDLLSGVRAARLSYRNAKFNVVADRPQLDLSWPALLTGLVRFNRLVIDELDIELLGSPDDPAAGQPPLIELPLSLEVKNGQIGVLNVRSSNFAESAADIRLSGAMRDARLRLDKLQLRSRGVSLNTNGRIRFSSNWPIEARVAWALEADAAITGSGDIKGDLAELKLTQNLTVPESVRLQATLNDVWSQPQFDAVATARNKLSFAEAGVELRQIEARANGTIDAYLYEFSGGITIANLPGEIQVNASGNGNAQMIVAENLEAALLDGRAYGSGTLKFDSLELNAGIQARGLDLRSIDARLPYLLDANTVVTGLLPNQVRADLSRVAGKLEELEFNGNGNIEWREGILSTTSLQVATARNMLQLTGQLYPDVSAEFDLVAHLNEVLTALQVKGIDPNSLGDGPVNGSGNVVWRDGVLSTDALQLSTPANRLQLNGKLWPVVNADFDLAADNLNEVFPLLQGQLSLAGRAGGSAAKPELALTGTASELSFADTLIGQIELNASIAKNGAISIDTLSERISYADINAKTLALNAGGTLSEFVYRASIDLVEGNAAAQGTGRYRPLSNQGEATLALQTDRGELSASGFGSWSLVDSLTTTLGLDSFAVDFSAHCWRSEQASLCAEAGRIATDVALNIELTNLPADRLPGFSLPGAKVSGVLNAGLSLSGTLDAPTGEGSALLQDLLVENLDEEEDALDVEISPQTLQLDFSLADRKLRLISSLLSDSDSSLQLDTTLGWPISDASAMSGMLAAQFDDFAAIEPLLFRYARITDPSGLITADLRLEGTLGEPDIRGTARLSEAAITIPATGIAVSDINLELSGQGNNPLQISGRAQSGGGNIAVTGTLDWKREIPQVNLLLNGNDFQLIRFPKQEVFVSPRLNIALTTDLISVDGQVTIPRADIEVIELPQTATQPSPDVVVIRERRIRQATSSGPDLKLDIEVILGDAVKLSAFGLDTGLKGSLRLKQRATDQRLLVEGNLRSIDGTFEAYGRELDIERGTLIFSGPVDEPLVDVRAIRSLRYEDKDIKVGVLLSGPLDRMQTRVFGEPAMSESDALSYLVLNRPLRRSNDVDSAELSTAAIALGLTNLIPGSKDLSTKIGLDEVGVESDTGGETSVIAGKRINDKFYIRYAYGLFDRIGRFVVRYDVGKGFSLEAGSGEEQTIDLLYSIDR